MQFVNETELLMEKIGASTPTLQEAFIESLKPKILKHLLTERNEEPDVETAEDTGTANSAPDKTEPENEKASLEELYQVLLCIGDSRG